jgi:hypothetical protein
MDGIDALIDMKNGQRNRIIGNTLSGTEAIPTFLVGLDDGIVLVNESNDQVSDNTITGAYDCGIETTGMIQNTLFDHNIIHNSPVCGIGAWYANSWKSNTVSNNQIDGSKKMLLFFRVWRLAPTEDAVYFSDNTFDHNVFMSSDPSESNAAITLVPNEVVFPNLPADGRDLRPEDFIIRNNVFTNNDFGTIGNGVSATPANAMTDGGGNSCPPNRANQPIRCVNAAITSPRPSDPPLPPREQPLPKPEASPEPPSNGAPSFVSPLSYLSLTQAFGLPMDPNGFQTALQQVTADTRQLNMSGTPDQMNAMANFITYGISQETIRLGMGERRALLRDYLQTVQRTDVVWEDMQRLATGRAPLTRNILAERGQASITLSTFIKIFGHKPNFQNTTEDFAWNTLLYRTRFPRDLSKESKGLRAYRALYHHAPLSPLDWTTVRVLGYVK